MITTMSRTTVGSALDEREIVIDRFVRSEIC